MANSARFANREDNFNENLLTDDNVRTVAIYMIYGDNVNIEDQKMHMGVMLDFVDEPEHSIFNEPILITPRNLNKYRNFL